MHPGGPGPLRGWKGHGGCRSCCYSYHPRGGPRHCCDWSRRQSGGPWGRRRRPGSRFGGGRFSQHLHPALSRGWNLCSSQVFFPLLTARAWLSCSSTIVPLIHYLALHPGGLTFLDKTLLPDLLYPADGALVDDLVHGLQPDRVRIALLHLQRLLQQHHAELPLLQL